MSPLALSREPTSPVGRPTAADVRAILETGLRAPSADGAQPWRLRHDGLTVQLAIDEARSRASRVGREAGLMSIGALMEGVRLESARRGFGVLVVKESGSTWRMTIGSGRLEDASLASALEARCTNRGPYAKTALARDHVAQIEAEAARVSNIRVSCSRDVIAGVARAQGLAERVRFDAVPPSELHRWLRFTPEAVEKERDGLDVRLLALRPHEALTLRFSAWPALTALMRALGAGRLAGRRAEREILASGGVGVVVQDDRDDTSFVESGRALMRAWLRATALGYAFAPVTAATLLPLAQQREDRFDGVHGARLAEAEALLRKTFEVPPAAHTVFLFRIGRPTASPPGRSLRRSLASFEEVRS